jgi:hypothetical protein
MAVAQWQRVVEKWKSSFFLRTTRSAFGEEKKKLANLLTTESKLPTGGTISLDVTQSILSTSMASQSYTSNATSR